MKNTEIVICPHCSGTGKVKVRMAIDKFDGYDDFNEYECKKCNGCGRLIKEITYKPFISPNKDVKLPIVDPKKIRTTNEGITPK